ncbi:hypothetical protein [Trichothermofontia sp.]
MSNLDLKNKVLEEIQLVPEEQLNELYHLIHTFRLRVNPSNASAQNIMQFAGCWQDLPPETYNELIDNLSQRRQQAFSQRENREASFD